MVSEIMLKWAKAVSVMLVWLVVSSQRPVALTVHDVWPAVTLYHLKVVLGTSKAELYPPTVN